MVRQSITIGFKMAKQIYFWYNFQIMVERGEKSIDRIYHHPMFTYDGKRGVLIIGEGEKKLAPITNNLLNELLEKPNVRRHTEELVEKVFGEGYFPYNLKWYIGDLRKEIEPNPKHPKVIISVGYHQGYVLYDPNKEELAYVFHSGLKYYPERSFAIVNDERVPLYPTENSILYLLARNINTVVIHRQLEEIWADKEETNVVNALKLNIESLRRKLEPGKRQGKYEHILSVPKEGYILLNNAS